MPDVPPQEEEYELLPHKEIEELKEELSKLKEFEIAPSKKLHVSLMELNAKLDKLLTIFEDASHEMRVEEGGLNFTEKMKPLLEKMNKILEQNSEIASGILALADMVKGVKPAAELHDEPQMPLPPMRPSSGMPSSAPPGLPPLQGQGVPPPPTAAGLPPLPPLPKRRTFGL